MIKSVQKALSILTFVAQQDERPVSLGRIAQGVGLNVATCAHLVETLCEENYLEKVSRREGYIMGPQMHVSTRCAQVATFSPTPCAMRPSDTGRSS